jgi:hypothetical protein
VPTFTSFRAPALLCFIVGVAAIRAQAEPAPADRFGGDTRVRREATGWFRFEAIGGRWFFVTPEGHPFVALGANHMGPYLRTQGRESGLWRRLGATDAAQAAAAFLPEIRALGLNAGDAYQPEETYKRALPWISFFWYGPQNQTFVDVFDAAQLAAVRRRALEHARSVADNPWVLGLGGPDLQIWDAKLVRRYRELPPASAGRRRYLEFLRARHGGEIARLNAAYGTAFASFDALAAAPKIALPEDAADDALDPFVYRWRLPVPPEDSPRPLAQADHDAFCALVAATLFPVVRAAVNEGAPHHLFLGEHLALRMTPDAVLAEMAKHIDGYLAQAVEISPRRPPEWQIFDAPAWDREAALVGKPVIVCDWGALFSFGESFDHRGGLVKPEQEASDDAARWIQDAFARPYVVGLFLCKLAGNHRNDTAFFQDRASRTYLQPDGAPYAYRTATFRAAAFAAQAAAYAHAHAAPASSR